MAEFHETKRDDLEARVAPTDGWLKRKCMQGGAGAAILLTALKFKTTLLFALTKLKFLLVVLKLGKFASTFGSMFVMIFVYAQLHGWAFGVGFVLLLLIHEMGHYLTAQYLGLNVGSPIFIPFVGAFIAMKEMPPNAATESTIALGGPMLGTLSALLCIPLYFLTGSDLFLALAYIGFMLNLFNLIPIHPLDGGRIVASISPWLWLIGVPLALIVSLRFFNPIIVVVLALGCIRLFEQFKTKDTSYYSISTSVRWVIAALYFGIITILGIGMTWTLAMHGAQTL